MRRVVPFMQPDYFEGTYRGLFKEFVKYVSQVQRHHHLSNRFRISISESEMTEEMMRHASDILPDLFVKDTDTELDWLMDQTEKWCQDRALFNAVMESISIIDGKHQSLTKNALPDILSKALSVTFDSSIGHDYLQRCRCTIRLLPHGGGDEIPFDLEYLNKITKGGLPNKSLNIVLAGTGVGKSLFMCHCASAALAQGKNVLYITLEMSEERIAERIDANLMDTPLDQIETLSKDMYRE